MIKCVFFLLLSVSLWSQEGGDSLSYNLFFDESTSVSLYLQRDTKKISFPGVNSGELFRPYKI